MKLHFLLARRTPPEPSQIVVDVSRILRGHGLHVSESIAEETLARPDTMRVDDDLFLLKSYTDLSLAVTGVLHEAGARLINSYPGCLAARNKIVAAQILAKHGIPAPRCWVTGDLSLLRDVVQHAPIIVKPFMGWRGEGIRIVRNESELASFSPFHGPMLIQEYLQGGGEDLRLYGAGDEIFATRKPFSQGSFSVPGQPVRVSPEMREIALACSAAFGLGLFGVDVIETAAGPFVVDVNYFPGYKGVPGAAEVVADFIERYAYGAIPESKAALA